MKILLILLSTIIITNNTYTTLKPTRTPRPLPTVTNNAQRLHNFNIFVDFIFDHTNLSVEQKKVTILYFKSRLLGSVGFSSQSLRNAISTKADSAIHRLNLGPIQPIPFILPSDSDSDSE